MNSPSIDAFTPELHQQLLRMHCEQPVTAATAAERCGISLLQFTAWLQDPRTRHDLAALRFSADFSMHMFLGQQRLSAIVKLLEISNDAEGETARRASKDLLNFHSIPPLRPAAEPPLPPIDTIIGPKADYLRYLQEFQRLLMRRSEKLSAPPPPESLVPPGAGAMGIVLLILAACFSLPSEPARSQMTAYDLHGVARSAKARNEPQSTVYFAAKHNHGRLLRLRADALTVPPRGRVALESPAATPPERGGSETPDAPALWAEPPSSLRRLVNSPLAVYSRPMVEGHPIETLVWADARCVDAVGQVLGRMQDVHVLAVGGPRKAQVAELATRFDAPAEDDLRKMLVDRPAAYLLLATAAGVSAADLAQARQSSTVTLAIEPPAFAFDAEPLRSNGLPAVVSIPWLRQSRTFLAAANPHEALGTPHTVNITAVGPARAGSLLARLYDALETTIHLLGMPDALDAALSGSHAPGTIPADDLRSLSGHLTAHLRFSGDRAALIQVSDRAPAWLRRITATGSEGLLDWSDTAYRLTAPDGHTLDEIPDPPKAQRLPTPASASHDPAVDLIVHQWQRLLDGSTFAPAMSSRHILACCHAAALSCRTGQLESPTTFLRLGDA